MMKLNERSNYAYEKDTDRSEDSVKSNFTC